MIHQAKNSKINKDLLTQAVIGMYGNRSQIEKQHPTCYLNNLLEALDNGKDPIIHDNSTSGWINNF
jgi:hypothetical protein